MSEVRDLFFEITPNSTIEDLTQYGEHFVYLQKGVLWWLGDCARYAKARFGDDYVQCFPVGVSPGLLARCEAVANAYPNEEDRNPLATWTQAMQVASKPDRKELLKEIVSKGQTSDESRKALSESSRPRWLLVIDANFWLTKHYFSGADIETAVRVSEWIQRMVERLRAKGLTDCAICFDGPNNFRKDLTEGAEWEGQRYKDRPPKPFVLTQQLHLGRELLEKAGFRCVSADGFEADDLIASYAEQFQGRTSILGIDKDLKQLLSDHVNMLTDVTWDADPSTGDMMPDYQWFTAKDLVEQTRLTPAQHRDFQIIAGDTVDGIKGAPGIGEKGAADLLLEFGTLEAVIEAARKDDERIKPKKREALIQLAERLDIVRQLVTLRTDLNIPMDTKL